MDSDPTPGDPERISELSEKLLGFADDVAEGLDRVRSLAGEGVFDEFLGQSADAFAERFESVPDNLTKLHESYDLAGQALSVYGPRLADAQRDADAALEEAQAAQEELATAQSALSDAAASLVAAQRQEEEQEDEEPEGPDAEELRGEVRRAVSDAESEHTSAQSAVDAAQSRLDAARRLAEQAREAREEAAHRCKERLEEASDAGMENKHWWEKAADWVVDNWDTIVNVCKVIVAVVGIIAMIIGGPLALLVLAAALVVLADTLIKYAQGKATLWDVAFAALDCIPGMKGLTTLGGLARGLRSGLSAARTGLRGMAQAARGLGRQIRQQAVQIVKRNGCGDPVDVATGELILSATDLDLPGILPLTIERHHISTYRHGRWFGISWASTLDQRLLLEENGVRFVAADGMILDYPVPLPDLEAPVLPVEGPRWPLAWTGQPSGEMTVHQPESGRTLHFTLVPGRRGNELPLTAITDRNTNRIDLRYDDQGAPAELVHSGYRVGVATYDERVTALTLISDPDQPLVVTYDYDTADNLAKICNSSGLPLLLDYDDHHRLTRWEDRNGTWYRYEYDPAGRVVFSTGTDRVLEYSYAYDPENLRTTATDSLGHTTVYQFNDGYQLIAETDPLGNTTHHEWDRYDRILTVTDPLGHTTRYEHDEHGQVVAVHRPDGSQVRTEYNELGLPTEITQPDGATWEQAYDARGNRIVLLDPAGNRTRLAYDEHGGLASITDALGQVTRIACDAAGLPATLVDPVGEVTRCERDAFGRPVKITDPLGATSVFAWTVEGKPVRSTDPVGGTRRWEWDDEGNLLAFTDENGGVTQYEYGPFDLPISQTDSNGTRYLFTRDTELNLIGVTDPAGRTWGYTYDAAGRLTAESDFDGRTTRYTLDPTGKPLSRTNQAGETITCTYDSLGRLASKATPDGQDTEYAYDLAGRIVRATAPDVEVTRRYDPLGTLISEAVNGRVLELSYDAVGQLTSRTTPSGHTSLWTYTPTGQPASLTTAGRVLSFDHDPVGRETSRRINDRLAIERLWDGQGRLIAQELTATGDSGTGRRVLQRRAYDYRPDGYLTAYTDAQGTARYTLDAAGQVTAVSAETWSETYAYDQTGNQTTAEWSSTSHRSSPSGPSPSEPAEARGSAAWEADATGERRYSGSLLTRAGNVRYEHDAAGRTILRQKARPSRKPDTWRYTWDAENRLTHVTTPDGVRWRYLYDPFDRRIGKQRLADDGETVVEQVTFTWHHTTLVEQITTATGGNDTSPQTLTWDYAGLYPLAQTEWTPPADAAAMDQAEVDRRFYAIVTDLVGAPIQLVDDDGGIAWHARTTLWGATATAPGSSAHIPLRFPGQYEDEETGWHYNYHRHYDPTVGRYATPDPLGLLPAPNPYTYTHNPLTWADPLGLAAHSLDDLANNLDNDTYFHYTNEEGYNAIMNAGGARFVANDRGKLFFTQDMLSPGDVENFIFIGNPMYRGKGDFVIAFRRPEGVTFRPGEQPNEVIHQGGLKIPMDNILFHGRNPF